MKRYDTEAFLLRAETLLNEKFFDIYIYVYTVRFWEDRILFVQVIFFSINIFDFQMLELIFFFFLI